MALLMINARRSNPLTYGSLLQLWLAGDDSGYRIARVLACLCHRQEMRKRLYFEVQLGGAVVPAAAFPIRGVYVIKRPLSHQSPPRR